MEQFVPFDRHLFSTASANRQSCHLAGNPLGTVRHGVTAVPTTMSEYLRVAAEAARLAGEYQRDRFGTTADHEYKSPGDPVSEVDHESERRIVDRILAAFPDHAVLCEERGLVGSEEGEDTWIVDPLDGTSNFLRDDPDFAVSIALECENVLRAGVVYRPMSDTLYAASRDGPGGVDGTDIGVSPVDRLEQSFVALPYSPERADRDDIWTTYRALGERVEGIRTSGASALDLAYLATGRIDAVVGFDHRRWDCAAGVLLVDVAGGRVVDDTDGPDNTGDFAATNGHLHEAVLSQVPGTVR